MSVNCNSCKGEIKTRDVKVCPSCGAMVCDSCFTSSGGVCEYCSSDLTYLQ